MENKNIYYLKDQIRMIISDYYQKKSELNKTKEKNAIFNELMKCFEVKSYQELRENLVLIDILMGSLYEKEEADMLRLKIHVSLNNIDNFLLHQEYYKKELIKEEAKLEKLVQTIFNDNKDLKAQSKSLYFEIHNESEKIYEYRNLLNALNNENELIKGYQLDILDKLMEMYEFTDKEKILVYEYTRVHNGKIKYGYRSSRTPLTKIIKENIKLYDQPIYKIDALEKRIESIYRSVSMLNKDEFDNIKDLLPELETGLYTEQEYEYIYKGIINKILIDLSDMQDELSTIEIYKDQKSKTAYIEEYNREKTLLYIVKKYFIDNKMISNVEEEIIEEVDVNNIFFSTSEESELSYFERDLKKLPEETLEEVMYLLEHFRKDTLMQSEIKVFNSNNRPLTSYQELRGDQIRIVFKNLFSNNYVFVGVTQKKSDNDLNFYRGCARRNSDIDLSGEKYELELEKAKEVYSEILKYIEENKRKGNRY